MTEEGFEDEQLNLAIRYAIEKANKNVDWEELDKKYGPLDKFKIAFKIADAKGMMGFCIMTNKLQKLSKKLLEECTHVVTTDSQTFWAIAAKEATIDTAYYTWQTVVIDPLDHHIASMLKVIFDKIYGVL